MICHHLFAISPNHKVTHVCYCISVLACLSVCMCLYVFRFIQYCTDEGGYTGLNRGIVEGTEEVIERLAALRIQMEAEGDACAGEERNSVG